MTNALALSNVGFMELTNDEMLAVDGGVDWGQWASGMVLMTLAVAIVVVAPEVAAANTGVIIGMAVTGYSLAETAV